MSFFLAAALALGPTVHLHMATTEALEVSYTLPEACTALDYLHDQDAAKVRQSWKPADDCTIASPGGLRAAKPSCRVLRLRIPAETRDIDRVYPWAEPVNGAIMANTSTYAVNDRCGPVSWRFSSAGGRVVLDGQPQGAQAMRDTLPNLATPVLFLSPTLASEADSGAHFDSQLSAQARALLGATMGGAATLFERVGAGHQPFLVVGASNDQSWRGDVQNQTMLRMRFPQLGSGEMLDSARHFVAHETAHLYQARFAESVLSEGGAEFMAWNAARVLGWRSAAQSEKELERALDNCQLAMDGGSWQAQDGAQRGRVPYDCGLAFHALAMALNAASGSSWERLHLANANPGNVALALECGAAAACKPHWFARMLGAETLDTVLLDYARVTGVLAPRAPGAMARMLSYRVVAQLMQADCAGQISMYREAQGARIGPVHQCASLREDMVIDHLAGLPVTDASAASALAAACQREGKAQVGLTSGATLTLNCSRNMPSPPQLYAWRRLPF